MKRVFALALFALSSSVFASYDLLIIADAATGFHRVDGQSGAYLGRFGVGQSSSVFSMSVNRSTGILYALTPYGIRRYNYSTGEYLGLASTTGVSSYAALDGSGNFVVADGDTTVTTYLLNGTTSTVNLPVGIAAQWLYLHDDNRWYLGDSNNGGRLLRSNTSSLTSGWTQLATGLGAFVPATRRGAVAHVRPGFTGSENGIYLYDSTTTDAFIRLNASFTYTGVGVYGVGGMGARGGAVRGHYGIYHVGQSTTAGQGYVAYYDDSTTFGGSSVITTSAFPNPTAMTAVLAPEPGTMLAIFGGIGALVLRRRRR